MNEILFEGHPLLICLDYEVCINSWGQTRKNIPKKSRQKKCQKCRPNSSKIEFGLGFRIRFKFPDFYLCKKIIALWLKSDEGDKPRTNPTEVHIFYCFKSDEGKKLRTSPTNVLGELAKRARPNNNHLPLKNISVRNI